MEPDPPGNTGGLTAESSVGFAAAGSLGLVPVLREVSDRESGRCQSQGPKITTSAEDDPDASSWSCMNSSNRDGAASR